MNFSKVLTFDAKNRSKFIESTDKALVCRLLIIRFYDMFN